MKFSPLRFRRDTPPVLLPRSDRRAAPLVLNLSPCRAGKPFSFCRRLYAFDLLQEYGLPPERGFSAPCSFQERKKTRSICRVCRLVPEYLLITFHHVIVCTDHKSKLCAVGGNKKKAQHSGPVVTDNHHLSPELRAELVSLARNTMATMHRSVPAWYEKVGPSLEAILKIDIAAGTTLLIIMLVFAPMEGLLLKLIAIALLGAMSSAGIWVLSVALRETGPQVC